MRKILVLILVACLCLSMVACGDKSDAWEPAFASSDVKPCAERAIEIIDDYLSFELSSEEASLEFEELNRRVDALGIDAYSVDTNPADAHIIQAIRHVDMFCFSIISNEADVHLYKDIISFQIGKEVSGKAYEADKVYLTDDSELYIEKFLDVEATPFADAFVYYDEDSDAWQVSLTFDKMNGVSVGGLEKYITEVLGNATAQGVNSLDLLITYSAYEQEAANICINIRDNTFSGYSLRSWADRQEASARFQEQYTQEEISNMTEYPAKYAVLKNLYEIESKEAIHKLLEETSAYVGIG